MEVLRTFTSHLWRQTSSSLCSASLRAIGTCNCIARSIRLPLRATHNTEEVIYSPRNTSMPCYSSLFTASVDGEIQGHCTANTGQLHLKHVQYLLVEEAVKESQLYLINSWNKIAQVGQGCSALHVAIFKVPVSMSKNNDRQHMSKTNKNKKKLMTATTLSRQNR